MKEGARDSGARVDLRLRFSRFNLPPVQSALVIGKKAPIGAKALAKAIEDMMPETFQLVEAEHPIVEAVIVRRAHLRRVPIDRLLPVLLRNAEGFMSDVDVLHFEIEIEVQTQETIEL